MGKVFLNRSDYSTYYQYRKAISEYRNNGWIIRNATGGVLCFESWDQYSIWKNQK